MRELVDFGTGGSALVGRCSQCSRGRFQRVEVAEDFVRSKMPPQIPIPLMAGSVIAIAVAVVAAMPEVIMAVGALSVVAS